MELERKCIVTEQYSRVLDSLNSGVQLYGKNEAMLYSNPAAQTILNSGCEKREIGLFDSELTYVDEGGNPFFIDAHPLCKVFSTHEAVNNSIIGVKCGDATDIKWVLLNAYPSVSEDGEIQSVTVSFIDITKSINTLETLKQSTRRFYAIFDATPAGICITDENGYFEAVNPAYCRIYRYEKEELIGKHFTIVVPEENRPLLNRLHDDFIAGEAAVEVRGEWDVVDAKGNPLSIIADAARIVGEDGRPKKATFVIDITEKRILERKLQEKKEELEQFNRELESQVQQEIESRRTKEQLLVQKSKMADMGEMLNAIAHQWKQPLNSMFILAQLLPDIHEDGQLTDEKVRESSQTFINQIQFLTRTLDDFRNFVKPSSQVSLFCPVEAIDSVIVLLKPQFEKFNINVSLVGDDACRVNGYINEFKQVVLNILNNAKDALQERKSVNPSIRVSLEKQDTNLTLVISDNAGGIPDELLPNKIFEEYTSTKGEQGTGIGLSLSKTIIQEKMNGTLSARNGEEGAEFIIQLNCAESGNM